MDTVIHFFQSFGVDFQTLWKTLLILLAGTLVISLLGRFIFGKRSALNIAVSSAIGIIFIYCVTVVIGSFGPQLDLFTAPLPFVSIIGQEMVLFSFTGAHYTAICTELFGMVVLSFLVNLADQWLPDGKTFWGWIFFRFLTVLIGYILHLVVSWIFTTILPAELVLYAPVILLGLLIILLLTSLLKPLVGAILSTVNPIIGGLYTFFFATAIGGQVLKAMLTTLILSALVWGLQHIGLGVISFAGSALAVYLPVLLLLIGLWYLITKLF